MDTYCDLHVHSCYSDGHYLPEKIVERALKKNISTLVFSEHNLINPELNILRDKYPINLPTGCEFSTKYVTETGTKNLHIVGIDFDEHYPAIQRVLSHNQGAMKPYIDNTIELLRNRCSLDIDCSYESLLKKYYPAQVNRLHLALEMVAQGFCSSCEECFDRFLGNRGYNRPAYLDNSENFAPFNDVVLAIKNAGGITVLAHPLKYGFDEEEIEKLLLLLKSLAGENAAMEVYYSQYNKTEQERLEALSSKMGLIPSAGSDFHIDINRSDLGQFPNSIYTKMMKARVIV